MSKMVKEWLRQLPEEVQGQAFLNLKSAVADEPCKTLSSALRVAFPWGDSNEGWEFWKNISEGVYKAERLNEILYN